MPGSAPRAGSAAADRGDHVDARARRRAACRAPRARGRRTRGCAGAAPGPARTAGRAGRASARRAARSPRPRSPRRRRAGAAGPRKSGGSVAGRWSVGHGYVEHRDLDRRDRGQVARDLAPALALVGAREHLAGARAEVEAGHVVARRSPSPRAARRGARRCCGSPSVEPLPARAGVARAPDRRLAVGHAARRGPGRAGSRRSVSRSCGCAAAAKPNSVGRPSVISVHDCAAVVAAVHADSGSAGTCGRGRPATSRACARRSRPPRARAASRRAGRGCAASTIAPSSVVSKMPIALHDRPEARRRRRGRA